MVSMIHANDSSILSCYAATPCGLARSATGRVQDADAEWRQQGGALPKMTLPTFRVLEMLF